jgi:methionine sulfoxide reductase catalytic subunit
MKRTNRSSLPPSEITPLAVFQNRRQIIAGLLASGLLPASAIAAPPTTTRSQYPRNARYSTKETANSFEDISSYNNFYEFGLDKTAPKKNAQSLQLKPWNITVQGEAEITGTFTLEDILKPHALEERVYRFRCVEAWSMVVPWLGFPLAALLKRFKPTAQAKYVVFKTLLDPKQMPGQREPILDWPYTEGLRMDEAMHPLSMLVTGLYGKELPRQNGAPLRLIVPWKYGFKSIKSIVAIQFTEQQPRSSWSVATPREYGFYANVNPAVDHPRWSQATERRLGAGLFAARQPTLPFNGYATEVAALYRGMDLRRFF